MNYKTLVVAVSLMSMGLPASTFAQCVECAMYPDRDPLNKGAPTPASKMGQSGGIAASPNAPNTVNNPNNARAEMRDHSSPRSGRRIGIDRHRMNKDLRSPESGLR